MDNSGFFGVTNTNFNWGLTDSLSSQSGMSLFGNSMGMTGAKAAGLAGAGLSAVGSILDIFAQENLQNTIGQQMQLADTQYNLQLTRIKANQDITNTVALQKANQDYGTVLARAGTTGVALSSGAINSQSMAINHSKNIAEFNTDVTATVQRMNSLFAKSSFYEQSYEKLKQSDSAIFGDFLSGGISIAAAVALV